ncbi:D-3-phosphoglycerate dehydrogenase / 2-oxoglutarate reductase [Phycisphaerales bacterium]|nr:D-3-phosphoglycerate dehydrogenase / 2-oxoglutarate reductase [Phycisphaerales bacterium]
MARPFVIQTEDLDPAAAAWLRESCDLVECPFSRQPEFDALLPKADGLVVRTYTRVDRALLDKAPRLKCVARAGVGLDRIDAPECRRRGVEVVHTPDANSVAVAEYVFALLHDALRPRAYLREAVSEDRWNVLRRENHAPAQFSELTLGILGLGRVGSRVSRIAQGFGMEVLYSDLVRIPATRRHGAIPVSVQELFRRSDILTIHIDSREGNFRFVGKALLGVLRSSAIVVNTSRGMVVDPVGLAEFLRANPHAKGLIDVHDPEPFGADYPLLGIPNAFLLPHLAAATTAAHVNMSWVVKDLWRVLQGERPEHPAP